MAEKSKKTAFAKYTVAAVAAILIIGVTVTTIMIKAKRKDVVVIESNSKSTEDSENTTDSILSESKQTKERTDNSISNKKKDTSETKTETQKSVTETSVSFPVDVNKVNLAQLCAIDGVGESTAKRILEYRDKVGIIRSMRQLLNVDGIGEKTLAKLEQYLYVSENDKADMQSETVTQRTNKTTSKSSSKASSKTTIAPKEPKEINVNKADAQKIAESLLITLENAQKIVDLREKIGGFKAKTEILLSKAISEDEYLRLEKYIII